MMMTIASPIDRSRYFFVPRTSGRRLLSLARLLRRYQPEDGSYELELAGKQLESEVLTLTQAYVDRYRERGPSLAAEEAELDSMTDVLFYILRDRVIHWELFERPGVRALAAKQEPGEFDYAACIEKAELAAKVHALLLAQGLEFLRLPYAEQAEHMLTLWTIVEQEQLGEALTQLIGAEFFGALADCRVRYAEMIEARAARSRGSAVNLRELSANLQRSIQNYVIALLAMIRDDEPENVAMIRAALRPLDALREQLYRERARAKGQAQEADVEAKALEPADELDQINEAVLGELVAEQEALEAQLGALSEQGEAAPGE